MENLTSSICVHLVWDWCRRKRCPNRLPHTIAPKGIQNVDLTYWIRTLWGAGHVLEILSGRNRLFHGPLGHEHFEIGVGRNIGVSGAPCRFRRSSEGEGGMEGGWV